MSSDWSCVSDVTFSLLFGLARAWLSTELALENSNKVTEPTEEKLSINLEESALNPSTCDQSTVADVLVQTSNSKKTHPHSQLSLAH